MNLSFNIINKLNRNKKYGVIDERYLQIFPKNPPGKENPKEKPKSTTYSRVLKQFF